MILEAKLDDKGHVLDAGADLNDPEAFGEYCKDAIILTVIIQVSFCKKKVWESAH